MKLIVFVIAMLSSVQLYAKTFYVCPDGNDLNSGLDPLTPFSTVSKVYTVLGNLTGGDSIRFCQGGVFPNTKTALIDKLKCTALNPCVIEDYPSNLGFSKPVISGNGFRFGNKDKHVEGLIVRNLELQGNGNSEGIFLYLDVSDFLIENVLISGHRIGVQASNKDGKLARITLRNSVIRDCTTQGWLGGASDSRIENNTFTNNGFSEKIYNHNIYWNSPTSNSVITGNTLSQSAVVGGLAWGTSLVIHGTQKDLTVEKNTVYESPGGADPHGYGITYSGYNIYPGEYAEGLRIIGNTVINMGGVAIGCSSCRNGSIEGNTIIHNSPFAQTAITTMMGGVSVDDLPTFNMIVKDNVIYFGEQADVKSKPVTAKPGDDLGNFVYFGNVK